MLTLGFGQEMYSIVCVWAVPPWDAFTKENSESGIVFHQPL